ncbi:MAG: hypothetical protein V4714_08365 [Bacteroidota bacterium]
MGVDTKAIIRKGVTLTQIKHCLEKAYGEITISPCHSDELFILVFKDGEAYRTLWVFFNECAKNDYHIDGILLTLGCWGNSVPIMKSLLNEFGGYLDENDCDQHGFYEVNASAFKAGKEFTKEDLFINKVIQKVGYDKLRVVMELLEEYKCLASPVDSSL